MPQLLAVPGLAGWAVAGCGSLRAACKLARRTGRSVRSQSGCIRLQVRRDGAALERSGRRDARCAAGCCPITCSFYPPCRPCLQSAGRLHDKGRQTTGPYDKASRNDF